MARAIIKKPYIIKALYSICFLILFGFMLVLSGCPSPPPDEEEIIVEQIQELLKNETGNE